MYIFIHLESSMMAQQKQMEEMMGGQFNQA